MEGNIMLFVLVVWPMAGAFLCYLTGRKSKKLRDYLADFITVMEFILLGMLVLNVIKGAEYSFILHDFCARGLELKLDGFRVLYGMIAAFMWMMTTIFSREYFSHYRNRNRYYFFLLMTLGATIGVFLSADLFTTFIFFEIMSFTSYVWVAHDEKKEALRAAETYLAVAVIGGLVMLMGLFLLYHAIGTLRMDELLEACALIENKMILYVAGGCMLFGFGAKAGMFPLHIWLPKAHPVAPAPASALLSGILTKSGVFGILVVSSNIFLHDAAWGNVILILGVITMFGGALLAVFSIDLKRTLACSSMSQIGFILVGVGMQGLLGEENALAVRGTLLHMVNHSLIKLVLFMAAGVVYMNLHKLDLNEIRGFGKKKPALMFSFLMGALGISGMPLWNGYVSKTLLHESIVEYAEHMHGTEIFTYMKSVEWIFLITGGLTAAYMLKLFVALFLEDGKGNTAKSASSYMNKETTFALLGSAVLLPIMGFLPNPVMDKIADLGQGFMHGVSPEHSVHYFSLVNLKGGMISLAIGVIVYFGFIRTCLMKKEDDGTLVYVNRWPAWLDIENVLYRPILLRFLPFVCAIVSRVCDKLVDGLAVLTMKTVLSPSKNVSIGTRAFYRIGVLMDDIVGLLNKCIFRKKPIRRSFINMYEVAREEFHRTNSLVARSVSFGLLLFCIGLLITLMYLLL